ncbi:gag-pol polyprotein [Cucumis melo var. makuwa]|uniref:Gag-pol polyprotein n=1 Tax=Cucumis melo var. makuwa TaxID=1194695 RepID=A0A5A7U8J6_CUCMM|nr:gag-pol polyprotein [Cucumis melo var. makuwa]TYK01807.1 gag-pol polyprotein [Cucumis melo var. makuwa]
MYACGLQIHGDNQALLFSMEKIIRIGNLGWESIESSYGWMGTTMITVDEVSIPKSEIDWTDAEEQAVVRNARALNAIFNGVDLNV